MKVTNVWIDNTLRMLKENSLASPDVRMLVPALEELLQRRKKEADSLPHYAVRCSECYQRPMISSRPDIFDLKGPVSYSCECRCGNFGSAASTYDKAIDKWNIKQLEIDCKRRGKKCSECVDKAVPEYFEAEYMRGRACKEFVGEWWWKRFMLKE